MTADKCRQLTCRLRTDLGGLYFNLVFMLALAGVYAVPPREWIGHSSEGWPPAPIQYGPDRG